MAGLAIRGTGRSTRCERLGVAAHAPRVRTVERGIEIARVRLCFPGRGIGRHRIHTVMAPRVGALQRLAVLMPRMMADRTVHRLHVRLVRKDRRRHARLRSFGRMDRRTAAPDQGMMRRDVPRFAVAQGAVAVRAERSGLLLVLQGWRLSRSSENGFLAGYTACGAPFQDTHWRNHAGRSKGRRCTGHARAVQQVGNGRQNH